MYKKTILANGLTVVTESIPYFSTVSLGLWWKTGGRYESEGNSGISHFIEHMLFKGTKKRSAHDIAREIDAVGGIINAFTAKEYTCLYARVIKKDMDLAIDVLADMYKNPLLGDEEIEREKQVVIQEIKMVEDSPEECLSDIFNSHYFKDHPLGMTILGRQENIEGFQRPSLFEHYHRFYSVDNLIITASGKVEHDAFVKRIEGLFGDIKGGDALNDKSNIERPFTHKGVYVSERDLEHVYLCIGTEAPSQVDRRRYLLYAMNAIIGGSMSSHLFQEIREKRGLVYSIYSYINCYHDTGTFGIATSVARASLPEVIRLIKDELKAIKAKGITERELKFSKDHIKGNLFISLESSDARMGRVAKNEIYFGGYIPLKETLREIGMIKKVEVDEIARHILRSAEDITVAALGPVTKKEVEALWGD